jgi:2-oxoglutarate dehydrogenase E2 component (dihydrolipoamide succinyltransferase)
VKFPVQVAGVVDSILYNVNDVVPVGTVIARIRTSQSVSPQSTVGSPQSTVGSQQPTTPNPKTREPEEAIVVESRPVTTSSQATQSGNGSSNRFYSPLVLNIAASEGVSMTELEKIPGTGNEGRVTKKDILQYVSDKKKGRDTRPEVRNTNYEVRDTNYEVQACQ